MIGGEGDPDVGEADLMSEESKKVCQLAIEGQSHGTHFRSIGADAVISVDGPWCHRAYGQQRNLHFPLLSDFEPKGEVSRTYGAYRKREGISERALFVIDRAGRISWSYVSPIDVNPGADGILTALENLAEEESRNGIQHGNKISRAS